MRKKIFSLFLFQLVNVIPHAINITEKFQSVIVWKLYFKDLYGHHNDWTAF